MSWNELRDRWGLTDGQLEYRIKVPAAPLDREAVSRAFFAGGLYDEDRITEIIHSLARRRGAAEMQPVLWDEYLKNLGGLVPFEQDYRVIPIDEVRLCLPGVWFRRHNVEEIERQCPVLIRREPDRKKEAEDEFLEELWRAVKEEMKKPKKKLKRKEIYDFLLKKFPDIKDRHFRKVWGRVPQSMKYKHRPPKA